MKKPFSDEEVAKECVVTVCKTLFLHISPYSDFELSLTLNPLQSEGEDMDDLNSSRPVQTNDWIFICFHWGEILSFVGNDVISGE